MAGLASDGRQIVTRARGEASNYRRYLSILGLRSSWGFYMIMRGFSSVPDLKPVKSQDHVFLCTRLSTCYEDEGTF